MAQHDVDYCHYAITRHFDAYAFDFPPMPLIHFEPPPLLIFRCHADCFEALITLLYFERLTPLPPPLADAFTPFIY